MTVAFERSKDGSLLLAVYVQPGASRSEVVGRHADMLKVRVSAPPERGRANRAVVELLSAAFAVPVAELDVVAGTSSRAKKVRFGAVDEVAVRERLGSLLGG